MIEECRTRGLTLSLDYIDEGDASRLADPDVLPAAIRSGQSQGVLITGHFPGEAVAQLCTRLPCVQVADYSPSASVDCIDHDDMRSIELIVDHLWSQGHRRIGFIGGEKGHMADLIRGNAFGLAMLRRGVGRDAWTDRCRDVIGPTADPDAAFRWVREALARGVTGWVTTNDAVGYRLLGYLAEHDILCPRDLSLCGFDHFDPPAGLPKLTSIDAPFEDMGKLAVTRLHQRIRQTVSSTHHTMIECRLMPGESTGPPSVPDGR
ncbi:MAG: LacI family DNA-binding transcriptional regulator [Planctomycetota bacterium]